MAHRVQDGGLRQAAEGVTASALRHTADGLADPVAFITANCRHLVVPLVPEIRLMLAHEALPLWLKTEEELGEMGLPPPFWAFAWAGGQALARYLLDHPHAVSGKRVIDLATGSGLVALAARLAGATHVLACDIDPFACAATTLNARAMALDIQVCDGDLLAEDPPDTDVVVCGDIFYERPLADRALAWFDRARNRGTPVLIGDPGRSYLPRERLKRLKNYSVPVTRELEDAEIKHTTVWQLI